MTKTITLKYFALLREQSGINEETLETDLNSLKELFLTVHAKYNFSLSTDRVRVAVNDEFVDWTTPITEGATIIFIPPVAGG